MQITATTSNIVELPLLRLLATDPVTAGCELWRLIPWCYAHLPEKLDHRNYSREQFIRISFCPSSCQPDSFGCRRSHGRS